jgi:ribosome-associated protein
VGEHPDTDIQQLRSLIRQARKDAAAMLAASAAVASAAAPDAPAPLQKQSKASKEIFQLVRARLAEKTSGSSDVDGEDEGDAAQDD